MRNDQLLNIFKMLEFVCLQSVNNLKVGQQTYKKKVVAFCSLILDS